MSVLSKNGKPLMSGGNAYAAPDKYSKAEVDQLLEGKVDKKIPVDDSVCGFTGNQKAWKVSKNQGVVSQSLNTQLTNLTFSLTTTGEYATDLISLPLDFPVKYIAGAGSTDTTFLVRGFNKNRQCIKFRLCRYSPGVPPTATGAYVQIIAQGLHDHPSNTVPDYNEAGATQAVNILNTYFAAKQNGRVFGYGSNWTYRSSSTVNNSSGDALMECDTLVAMVLMGVCYADSPYANTTAGATADFATFFSGFTPSMPCEWRLSKQSDGNGNPIPNWVSDPRLGTRATDTGQQNWWLWDNSRVFFPVNGSGAYDPAKLRNGDIVIFRKAGTSSFDNAAHIGMLTVENGQVMLNHISTAEPGTSGDNHLWKVALQSYINDKYPVIDGKPDFYFARPDYGRQ